MEVFEMDQSDLVYKKKSYNSSKLTSEDRLKE